ncbi:MAG: hypothetical protein L6R30_08325 [Thermoanaerobaculia bacterium]|nr:hypothetical protein [Thermoanaerobaculia bacterium]
MKKNRIVAAAVLSVLALAPLSALAETEASRETSATVKNTQMAEDRPEVRIGKLKSYLRGPNKEITGVVLTDGTTAQLPADIAKKVYRYTQTGCSSARPSARHRSFLPAPFTT